MPGLILERSQFSSTFPANKFYIAIMWKALLSKFRANRSAILLIGLAAAVRIVYLIHYSGLPDWDQLTVDNYYHHHLATSLANGNLIGDTTYFRAPFYTYCLGLLYAVLGDSWWVGRLFGIAIGTASVALTFILGNRLFGRKIGLIAAGMQAFTPMMIYFEGELLLDPLFTLLLQISLYRFLIWIESNRSLDGFWTGLALGLASITRPTSLIFAGVILLFLIVKKTSVGITFRQYLWCLLGLALMILPITARNMIVAGDPVLIASQGGINLYIGNNDAADGTSAVLPEPLGHNWRPEDVSFIAEQEIGIGAKPGEISSFWLGAAVDWVVTNPAEFVRLTGKKLLLAISNEEISNNRNLALFYSRSPLLGMNPFRFGLLFALAVAGVVSCRSRFETKLLIVVIVSYIVVLSVFFFSSRFRLPLLPFFILLAALGANELSLRLRQWSPKTIRLAAFVLLGGIISLGNFVPKTARGQSMRYTSEGLYHYAVDDFKQALRTFRKASKVEADYPDINLNLGNCFFRLGVEDSAKLYFQREARLHPLRSKAWVNLASIDLLNDNYDNAMAKVRHALTMRPYDVTANQVHLRTLSWFSTTSVAGFLAAAEEAADRTKDNIVLLNDAGRLLTEMQAYGEAQRILQRAVKSNAPPIESNGDAFDRRFKTSESAWRIEKARSYNQLAYIAGVLNQFEQALEHSLAAVESDPAYPDAYVNLVSALVSTGRKAQADSTLAYAAKRFPGNQYIETLKQRNRTP